MTTITLKPNEVKNIPLSLIKPDPKQVRQTFNEATLKKLAGNIKTRGLLQPVVVRKNGKGFFIKLGERRYRAAKIAKLTSIPCILAEDATGKDADLQLLMDQYAENSMREDLNPMDMAHLFRRCRDDFKMKVTDIPDTLQQCGIDKVYDRSTISMMIGLTELPDWAQKLIKENKITAAHGRVLTSIIPLDEKIRHTIKNQIEKDIARKEKNEGNYTVSDLSRTVSSIVEDSYPDARQAWFVKGGYGLNDAHLQTDETLYDVSKLSPEQKEKLKIVNIPMGHGGGSQSYITNIVEHEKLQKEAREKLREKIKKSAANEKKAATKKTGKSGKVEKNIEPKKQGLHDFLMTWLMGVILQRLENVDTTDSIFDRLNYWLAFGRPITGDGDKKATSNEDFEVQFYSNYDLIGMQGNYALRNAEQEINESSVINSRLFSLRAWLENQFDHDKLLRIAATKAVTLCDATHRCVIARHLKLEIASEFRVTDDFLKLYTKDGLIQLAKDAGLDKEDGWTAVQNKKGSDMRAYLVEQKNSVGCPDHVIQFIEAHLKEYDKDFLKDTAALTVAFASVDAVRAKEQATSSPDPAQDLSANKPIPGSEPDGQKSLDQLAPAEETSAGKVSKKKKSGKK